MYWRILIILFVIITIHVVISPQPVRGQEPLPAFPGAEGFGAFTPGGRGGQVLLVTNLQDSGSGSLRAAIETTGKRVVLFKVAGVINLEKDLIVKNPYVSIFAQTAPGEGITLKNNVLSIETHDVIIRGLRSRVGDEGTNVGDRDGLRVSTNSRNVIIDHCSVSWGIDENMSTYSAVENVTVQWCIFSEALFDSFHSEGTHSMGFLIGDNAKKISVHHNVFAHNNQRNSLMKGNTETEFINNVIYNWGVLGTHFDGINNSRPHISNIIGNYYIKGTNSTISKAIALNNLVDGTKLYLKDNIHPLRPNTTDDEWLGVSRGDPKYRSNVPVGTVSNVAIHTAQQALSIVPQQAGVTVPKRDVIDERVIRDITNGTGAIINSPREVGGWVTSTATSTQRDGDGDGIPDSWEQEQGLNPTDARDSVQLSQRGYMWVEEYSNALFGTSGVIRPTAGTVSPTAPAGCAKKAIGDSNCDGTITVVDFEIWRKEMTGQSATQQADFNGDKRVSIVDFEIWRKNYS